MMAGRFGYGMHGGGGMFMMLLFALIIIGLVYFMLRKGQAFQSSPTVKQAQSFERSKTDPAEAILRERYARGEINDDEFDQRLTRLKGEHVKVEEKGDEVEETKEEK